MTKFCRFTALLLLSITLPLSLLSQEGTISGLVSDEKGPLIAASITVQGTSTGTTTDLDGNYSLTLPPGTYMLEVSYLGYDPVTRQVVVTENSVIHSNFNLVAGILLGDIVVTGTRSKPRSVLESAVPIDNFESAVIERQGNGDLTETLKNLIPSFTATPLEGDGSGFVRSTSLRGLPPDETLILINSKRRHRSALIAHFGAAVNAGAHATDIGLIPSIALKNIEVLRDGAAAQYGSDAIAGVINFLLKGANKGVEVQSQLGQWYGGHYGAETDYKFAINFGLPLTRNGFINVSGEYVYNQELSRGLQHSDAIGVEGAKDPAMIFGRPESSGFRSVWNAEIELSPKVQFYDFGNFADTYGNLSFIYRGPGKSGILIPLPNDPFDPSKGNFCLCDQYPAGFTPRLEGFQTDFSNIMGVRGTFGEGFNFDISASYGRNRINYVLNNTINPSFGPLSETSFRPGDLQQEDLNFNVDISKELSKNFNLAIGLENRRETYTMYTGEQQPWAAGPWASVSSLINPETGDNYGAPSIGANGLSGTSPSSSGSFDSRNWAAYIDTE